MPELDLEAAKLDMLRRQLCRRGIHDRLVLAAMTKVPRERFIDEALRSQAYDDRALCIDCGQTISQPYIVGLMTEALELSGSERVLEIGTGSGYQTAVLAELAQEVISIERHEELSREAGAVLAELGYQNVRLLVGDGTLGWPEGSPYDRILVTAAPQDVPPALFDQLAEGGILVIPTGGMDSQILQAVRKVAGEAERTDLSGCRFVPLIGEQGWPG
jgi:protein-L-isoaspartate(D-aspartate) O-methyltransferase